MVHVQVASGRSSVYREIELATANLGIICAGFTNARVPFVHEFVVGRAQAPVTALHVGAFSVQAGLRTFALVDVRAVAAGAVQFVPVVALATEHAERVLALAKHAQVVEHVALINVCKRLNMNF